MYDTRDPLYRDIFGWTYFPLTWKVLIFNCWHIIVHFLV